MDRQHHLAQLVSFSEEALLVEKVERST